MVESHFHNDRCPGGHADDPVLIAEAFERVHRELRQLRDAASRDRADRAAWERSVRAQIRRDYEDQHRHYAWYAMQELQKRAGHFGLAEFARALPDKPTPAQLEALRERAEITRRMWLDPEAPKPHGGYVDDLVAEIARLRGLVYEYAQGWHWKASPPTGERCVCEGCALIRALDDVEVPPGRWIDGSSVDAAPVADLGGAR